ncbi:13295_t:CDS:2, partial [Funneliformis geosporum]
MDCITKIASKSLEVAELSEVECDIYGIFPIQRKLLNVREGSHTIMNNSENQQIIKIIGRNHGKKYTSKSCLRKFITPIVKGDKEVKFLTIPEHDNLKEKTPDAKNRKIKRYKFLGTDNTKEVKQYFNNLKHLKKLYGSIQEGELELIIMA